MAMSEEQFDALVKRLESFARRQPEKYKLRVSLLAALGYIYIISLISIFLILAGVLAICGFFLPLEISGGILNVLAICLSIVALAIASIIFRALRVYFPVPKGLELSRSSVPQIYRLIDELTSTLQTPGLHHILLTGEFNAGVAQIPSPGLSGWQKNYLILGLPLMQALSLEQFRAVLAHELGHLSGNHSRFAGRIYTVRQMWVQAWERLQQSGSGWSTILLDIFFRWYAPFFGAYSFVLARLNEYEADGCAAELAGADNAVLALVNLEITAKFLENSFWPDVYKQAHHQAEPPAAIYTNMLSALRNPIATLDARQWLESALTKKTSNADTHPCLSDRLLALGYSPAEQQKQLLSGSVIKSAAQQLLGDTLEKFTHHLDRNWKKETFIQWRHWHTTATELLLRLKFLEKQAENQVLTLQTAWELAHLTAEFKGDEAAIPRLQEVLAIQPNHQRANYKLGEILLQQKDERGINYIEKAMEQDFEIVISGCESIGSFLRQQGYLQAANQYKERAQQHYELLVKARAERSFVSTKDKFIPHGLPKVTWKRLCRQLYDYPEIKDAYFVQKVVKYFPEKPLYVLGVIRRGYWWVEDRRNDYDQALLNELIYELEFSGQIYIVILNWHQSKLKRVLRQIPNGYVECH